MSVISVLLIVSKSKDSCSSPNNLCSASTNNSSSAVTKVFIRASSINSETNFVNTSIISDRSANNLSLNSSIVLKPIDLISWKDFASNLSVSNEVWNNCKLVCIRSSNSPNNWVFSCMISNVSSNCGSTLIPSAS